MFDAARSNRSPFVVGAVLLAIAMAVSVYLRPDLLEQASEKADLWLAGAGLRADPFASKRVDHPYPDSPLAEALRLEEQLGPTDRDAVLAWADDLAHDMGLWLLRETGSTDVAAAEDALWDAARQDAFALELARQLRNREVYARQQHRLSGIDGPPLYVHPDELAWIGAHVAFRLDLRMRLLRSPVHHYLVWTSPSGQLGRTVELTNFRRVDALGKLVASDEPSVGRRLIGPEDLFPSGAGGIHELQGDGVYREIPADQLTAELLQRIVTWKAHTAGADFADAAPLARYELGLMRGMEAWTRGDTDTVAAAYRELAALRRDHGDDLPALPKENVLGFAAGVAGVSLRPIFAHYDTPAPDRPADDLHEMAMWLDLRDGRIGKLDYNRRVVPLTNVSRRRDEQLELCQAGRIALAQEASVPTTWLERCEALEAAPE
jgi:hypothetical protein